MLCVLCGSEIMDGTLIVLHGKYVCHSCAKTIAAYVKPDESFPFGPYRFDDANTRPKTGGYYWIGDGK